MDANQPGTNQPGTNQPGASQPGVSQSGASQPGATAPGANKSGATAPGGIAGREDTGGPAPGSGADHSLIGGSAPRSRAGETSAGTSAPAGYRLWVIALPAAWLVLLLATPLAIVLLIAFAQPADGVPPYSLGLSLDNLMLVASDPLYREALLRSVRVASVSTVVCLVVGFPMALAIAKAAPRWQNALLLAVMLPFWTGFLMRISAWIGLLADGGLIARMLGGSRLLYTDTAMYIGMIYTYLPFMVLPLYARLSRLDPALMEAAADLGAPPWNVFLRVILPLSLPAVAAGAILVFVPAIGEYVIPALLGGPQAQLIGKVLWEEFFSNRDWPTASAVAVWLLVVLVAIPGLLARIGRTPRI
ncbi:MAG TPA: ABC transporter permease subunit [Rhodopila sp.]